MSKRVYTEWVPLSGQVEKVRVEVQVVDDLNFFHPAQFAKIARCFAEDQEKMLSLCSSNVFGPYDEISIGF